MNVHHFIGRLAALASICLPILAGGGLALPSPARAAAGDVSLVTGSDYAPYTSPDLPGGGIVTELVRQVFGEAGYETRLDFYPWKRSYTRVLEAVSDATFPYARTEEREALFLYSRPINKITIRLFLRQEDPIRYSAPADMAGKIYCQPLGYRTEPEFSQMIEQGTLKRHEGKDMETCFHLLSFKRVDFVVSNDLVAWESARRALGDKTEQIVRAADIPVREVFEYLIISRKNPRGEALIGAFNAGYERLLNDGTLKEIWQNRLGRHAHPVE